MCLAFLSLVYGVVEGLRGGSVFCRRCFSTRRTTCDSRQSPWLCRLSCPYTPHTPHTHHTHTHTHTQTPPPPPPSHSTSQMAVGYGGVAALLNCNVSGQFYYPPGGFREWHTNQWDGVGWRGFVLARSTAVCVCVCVCMCVFCKRLLS